VFATVILVACGSDAPEWRTVTGNGWAARFPSAWSVERGDRRVLARPEEGQESLVVATFPLRRRFTPDLWDEAAGELDVVARELAEELSTLAELSDGVATAIDGRRARVYEIRYERDGEPLLERVAFLFAGRREYQLTCRIVLAQLESGERACSELFFSFEL
jgi:hypothetical protein